MFKNVLVGVDEGEGGRDAIALARVLLAAGGELTLAHVFAENLVRSRVWSDPGVDSRREHARELLEHAAAEARVEAHVRWRGGSSVGRGLHEMAESIEADLLVVGSSRRGMLGRVRLADDTRAALNGAPCAIAVAPTGYSSEPPPPMREIGLGYDGSPESRQALGTARALASETGAKLSAFEVVSVPSYVFRGRTAVNGSVIKDVVREARDEIVSLGGVEAHAAYGDTAEELTLYSASLDLLVLASRGYGPLGRLVHGSTTQQLARTARCPLLVLTRAAREASEHAGSEDSRQTASHAARL
ncbi:MAG TPA: universal stress protein [Solirubrobacteraceae bacterium]|nr:universal stress protein [Solirubrobacteraceae bacterium]